MQLFNKRISEYIKRIQHNQYVAKAQISGDSNHKKIHGTAKFYPSQNGTLVQVEVFGLPVNRQKCSNNIFALHIHQGASCTSKGEDPFGSAGTHYNPNECNHPAHAGDLPPLFANKNGYAYLLMFTDRFSPKEIIGKTIIIHSQADDFKTQPSGDSGSKIACGEIRKEF